MSDEYNHNLCEERHGDIKSAFIKFDLRLKKVENRFLAIMTVLVVNLLGVIATLAIIIMKSKGAIQ